MPAETIYIAGRYNKYLRDLSQSPWIDKDDVRVKDSVQELIEDGLKQYLKFEKSIFASSGREDVDVRMLGRGRPFTFKLLSPEFLADYNEATLAKIQVFVNSKHKGKVHIRDLQYVTKSDITKYMTETLESKQKQYRALCCCSRSISDEDINRINAIKNLVINQLTPIRVLQRRTWATRKRTIYEMSIEQVKMEDFEVVKAEHLSRMFVLVLTAEAGTYIKEFVHGDFGRTTPNIAQLLGQDCEADLVELDVMEVYSDWPPEKSASSEGKLTDFKRVDNPKMVPQGADDKTDASPEELAELYTKALNLMREAESKPRGDKRQELYIRSRQLFERGLSLVESLDLFSDNETADDIATANLKYILIRAHLAKVLISSECASDRLATFTKAQSHIMNFLRDVSQYELGGESIEAEMKEFSVDVSDISQDHFGRPSPANLEDAMRQRDEKILRFKRLKALEDKVASLEQRMASFGEGQVDDEVAREYYLNLIKKISEDALESLEREVRPAIFFETTRTGGQIVAPYPASGSSSSDRPKEIKPITIVRDQFQKQVFGMGYPSHPTVTVDEFITKKIKDGDLAFDKHKEVYTNSLQRYAEQPNLRKEQEELSDEEREAKEDKHDEVELDRKRKWDEFKDDNPRGSGNRHNMG